jgi:prephenate dehydratase
MRIAIQGATGSFHHIAAEHWFGSGNDYICCETFGDVFTALSEKKADSAVVAIENSRFGSITEVYDLLLEHKFPIVGEVAEQIHQQLIGLPGAKLTDIDEVYSHPVALGQTSRFLDSKLKNAEKVEFFDTAAAVEHIKRIGSIHNAAIAGHLAAEMHNMRILAKNIEDEQQNYTRFLIIKNGRTVVKNANKTSLVLQTDHQPSALYRAMGIFAKRNVNLTKLQSRPISGKVWKYQFYIDVETAGKQLDDIRHDLIADGCKVTILGQYMADPKTYED